MTWREFTVLLNGLSPYGALASHYDEEAKRQKTEHGDGAQNFWNWLARTGKPS